MLANFLKKVSYSVKSLSAKKYVFVTGNEACDLDSIASATAYAYIRDLEVRNKNICYVPVCNIPVEDLSLRTEAIFCLQNCNIKPLDLPCQTNILSLLREMPKIEMELILVDHHEILSAGIFSDIPIVEIVDHHPVESNYVRPPSCDFFRIERVGSCSSIVADEMLKRISTELLPVELCKLLLGAILIDTVGLSEKGKELKRATELDFKVAASLEALNCGAVYSGHERRQSFYQKIFDAKFCITGLTLWDLLRRDMKKVISGTSGAAAIACSTISGMDYKELMSRSDFVSTATRFCTDKDVRMLVCITVSRPAPSAGVLDSQPEFPPLGFTLFVLPDSHALGTKLVSFLEAEPNILQLSSCSRPRHQINSNEFIYNATVGNKTVTRKQILPLLAKFLSLS